MSLQSGGDQAKEVSDSMIPQLNISKEDEKYLATSKALTKGWFAIQVSMPETHMFSLQKFTRPLDMQGRNHG